MTAVKRSSLNLLGTASVITIGTIAGALVGGVAFMAYTALLGKGTATTLAAKGALSLSANTASSSGLVGLLFTSTGSALGGGTTGLGVVRKQVTEATEELKNKVDKLSQQLEVSQSELAEQRQENVATINVDLQQIRGIGPKYSKILQEAGINTIKELAQTASEDLYPLLESSIEKHLLRLDEWIAQAQQIVAMDATA